MVRRATYDPADQKRRRRRAQLSQQDIAERLNISDTSVSDYEQGRKALPFDYTGEDYERALAAALLDKKAAK